MIKKTALRILPFFLLSCFLTVPAFAAPIPEKPPEAPKAQEALELARASNETMEKRRKELGIEDETSPAAPLQQVEKQLVGLITGVLPKDNNVQIFVQDKDKAANTLVVSPKTEIKKQIDLSEIQPGEFVGVIYEMDGYEKIALSTAVGSAEKVALAKEELLKFAPKPEMPEAPEVPEAPEMPPAPEGEGPQAGAPPPEAGAPGQEPGVDKSKEATGFTPEEAANAKKKKDEKNPLDDVLSQEGPLSSTSEQVPPEFTSGKVKSLDLKSPAQLMVIEESLGNEVKITVGPQPQIVNRYLDMTGLEEKYEVEVLYEERGKEKLAKYILIARPNPA